MADREEMDDDELMAIIRSEQSSAYGYLSGDLSTERARALDYYYGRPFGNEVPDRSQAMLLDVADTVEWIMPAIMKVFTAGEEVVTFRPVGAEDEAAAMQETAVLNHVVLEENNAFEVIYAWAKDGLLQKNGYVKVGWQEDGKREDEHYYGLVPDELAALEQAAVEGGSKLLTSQKEGGLWDATLRFTGKAGHVTIAPVPPEEMLVSVKTTSTGLQEAQFVQHRSRKTLSEIRLMGYEVDDDVSDSDDDLLYGEEWSSRRRYDEQWARESSSHKSMRSVTLRESYIRVDYDGDGIAELRRVVHVANTIVEKSKGKRLANETVNTIPFASWSPIPSPHEHIGRSYADLVMDLQYIKVALLRQSLDNMYSMNNSRTAINQNTVNLDDLLITRPGGVVRVNGNPGAEIMPMPSDAIGLAPIQLIEYLDTVKENRTGVTRYNQGTDANTLNKMLDIRTAVPMADGSVKTLGEIVDGDAVIGSQGGPTSVVKAHEIYTPETAFKMVFSSGDAITACGDHRWKVRTKMLDWRVVDTLWIYGYIHKYGNALYIPRVARPQFESRQNLPIDPYILGYWLGNGNSRDSTICTQDDEVVGALDSWVVASGGPVSVTRLKNTDKAAVYGMPRPGMTQALRDLGVSPVKHIPDIYLRARYEDRLELLRGLMDADGTVQHTSQVMLSQKEGRLADDAIRLIEGLGIWPTIRRITCYGGFSPAAGSNQLRITFSPHDNPFRIDRKASKMRPKKERLDRQRIVSVEPVEPVPMRCLTVDADDELFCVGRRYTVTSNTAAGISIISQAANQRIELIVRILAETGMRTLFMLVHELLRKNSTRALSVKLRGEYVSVDPRQWRTRTDVRISVGLGTGNKDQMLGHLQSIMAVQREILAGGGASLVTAENIHNTAKRMVENSGFKDADEFFTSPAKEAEQGAEGAVPSPEEERARGELELKREELAIKQGELEIKRGQLAIDQGELEIKSLEARAPLEVENSARIAEASLQQISEFMGSMQAMTAAMQQLTATLTNALTAPKVIERDASGRMIGWRMAAPPIDVAPPRLL